MPRHIVSAPFTATPAADDPPSPAPSGKSLRISTVIPSTPERRTAASASARLEDLAARRLLVVRQGPPASYRFSPASAEDTEDVTALQETYSTRRVSVISFIFSKPLDRVRGFADAFRLKRDKDDSNG
jgi:hypothetical protein